LKPWKTTRIFTLKFDSKVPHGKYILGENALEILSWKSIL